MRVVLESSQRQENSMVFNAVRDKKLKLFVNPELKVDFSPSPECGIVYLSEGDLIGKYSDKGMKCLKHVVNYAKPIVVIEKTQLTEQIFHKIQLEAFDLPDKIVNIIPVSSHAEGARILYTLAYQAQVGDDRYYRGKWEEKAVASISCIPGIGPTKSKAILSEVNTLQSLSQLSREELCERVPELKPSDVRSIREFFLSPP